MSRPMRAVERRAIEKLEKLTGLAIRWYPDMKVLAGYLDDKGVVNAQAPGLREAARILRERNLARIRNKKLTAQKGRCARCDRMGRPLHLHHSKFRSQGGDDREENLELICTDCHDKEHGTR